LDDEAAICISGQDLVIRTFEIPLIPKNELKGVVSFEVKKYIPFKLEELDYDFQILYNSRNKTSLVLFVGIKKDILNNYVSIFKQLNIKIGILEYSAFSVLRFLKLAGVSDSGVKASLCFDLNNEDEANFTVYENGFSLFSRDFVLTGEPTGFEQVAEADRLQRLEKLKNEIKISLDYYKRKFPEKNLKEIYVVSDKESQQELSALPSEAAIKFVDYQKALGKGAVYSSVLIKSFAASLFKSSVLKIKINLLGAKLKAAKTVPQARQMAVGNVFEGIKIDLKFVIFGAILCAGIFIYGITKIQPLKKELADIQNNRVKTNITSGNESIEELSDISDRFSKKISTLDNMAKNQMFATYPLNAVPPALPRGVWLENFNFNQNATGGPELVLSGKVYLADAEREVESVNAFLANLKKDQNFSRYFKEININSIDRVSEEEKSLLIFTIVCKAQRQG